jgi:two-component system, cell cycle response regulator DivK
MPGERILIVDDNLLNIELAACLLEADGFLVQSTTDPTQALALMLQDPPALVLMDVQMPRLDGLALTRQVKAEPALGQVPVLAFTAYAMKGDEERMRRAGCDGYIAKPIDVASFASTVRRHLVPGTARPPV